MTRKNLSVIVLGCGNMGTSHARAYHNIEEFDLVGLVDRTEKNRKRLSEELGGVPTFWDLEEALAATDPDVVAICTYPDTHAAFARVCLAAGAHVFVEKPLATTVAEAQEIADLARKMDKKVVVGYILRVHPAWKTFIELAQTLGKPLVMRMNLNQQSSGREWETHKKLMHSMSPIVDCGVHYVDVMCQMTESRPVRVSAIGARLTEDIDAAMYNYGQLQVVFEDGSIGWYEAAWGPMISETAFFVKDVMGPRGSVSIVEKASEDSDSIEGHTQTGTLQLHHGALNEEGAFVRQDEFIDTSDEPTHDELCELEQRFLLHAIREDVDLSSHVEDAVNSLRIVLAADEAFRTGLTVELT